MIKTLSSKLHRISPGWTAGLTTALFLLFLILVLPRQASASQARTGDLPSPDTSLIYAPQELYRLAGEYGPEARKAYIQARFTFDLLFPLVYGSFLATTLSWVSRRVLPEGSGWLRINLIPGTAVLFDFLENTSTSLVMGLYPRRLPGVNHLAPAFTALKWTTLGLSFALFLGGLAVLLWKAFRDSQKSPT